MLVCLFQLDVLEFVHENEYTHADLHAENIYVSSGSHPKVRHQTHWALTVFRPHQTHWALIVFRPNV